MPPETESVETGASDRANTNAEVQRGFAIGFAAALLLACLAGGGAYFSIRKEPAPAPASLVQAPEAVEPLAPVQAIASVVPSRWRALPVGSPLAGAKEVAFAQDASLRTDGRNAVYRSPSGEEHPLEVAAPVQRVFSAAAKLYAQAQSDDAPFLIAIDPASKKVEPVVLPLPCPFERLAGFGKSLAGACAGSAALAVSDDGGRSFRRHAVVPPAPEGVDPNATELTIEALAVSPEGQVAVAVLQRWWQLGSTEPLRWSWAHVGVGSGRSFSWSNLPGVASIPALFAGHGAYALATLEVDSEGGAEGELRPRTWRGGERGFAPFGPAGESCSGAEHAGDARGVALSEREMALLCSGSLISTLDGGRTWVTEGGFDGPLLALAGGDMRLLVRSAKSSWERKFVLRSAQGATAVRLPNAPEKAKNAVLEKIPLAPVPELREPALDGGLP